MTTENFIIRKCNELLKNMDSMNEQERMSTLAFILELQKHHVNKSLELSERTQETNEKLFLQNEQLEDSIEHYQNFIKDSGLKKQYEFYSRNKEVI